MIKTENLYKEIIKALKNLYLPTVNRIEELKKVEFNNFRISRIEGNIIGINKHIYIKITEERIEFFNIRDLLDWYYEIELEYYENEFDLSFEFFKYLEYATRCRDCRCIL